jgi:BED zinc finger
MSSPVESVARSQSATIQSVESEDEGRSIELSDKVRDTIDVPVEGESVEPAVDGRKRKSKTSEVYKYFLEVEVKEKGKMMKKLECIHCRKKYLTVIGGPTITLKRHIQQCACIKRAKGKKNASLILNHARVLMQPILIIQVAVMNK